MVREAIAGIDGIADLKVELHIEIPQVEVEVDLAKAQRYGVKPGDVRRAAAVLISGEEVGDIFVGWQDVRCERVEHARNTQQRDQYSRAAD